jgi:predicted aspartyl protease
VKFNIKSVLIVSVLFLTSCQQQIIGLFKKGEYEKQEDIVEVPFIIENGLIIIPVDIEGETYRFLLDTGAPNVVSKELAEKLNFKKKRSIKTVDSQGNSSVLDYVKVSKIGIKNAVFLNTIAAVADLKQADAIACLNIDGLIGANLMRKAYWQIDCQKNVLRIITNTEKLNIPKESYEIPFVADVTGTPLVHLRIGQIDVRKLKIDTGSVGFLSTDIDIYSGMKEKDYIVAERVSYGVSSVGLFGTSEKDTIKQVLLKDFSMGNLCVVNQTVDLKQGKTSLLGMSFFRNYIITLDWKRNTLFLTPQGDFYNAYTETFGISMFKQGEKMVVSMITEGSDAQKAGIEIGDIVLGVNDVDVANTTLEEYCRVIKLVRVKEVESIQVVIDKNGQAKEYLLNKMPVLAN